MTDGGWGVPPPPPWPAEPEARPAPLRPRWRGGAGREDGWAAVGLALTLVAALVAVAGLAAIVAILRSAPECDDVSCGEGDMYAVVGIGFLVPPTCLVVAGLALGLCLIGLWRGSRRGPGRTVAWLGVALSGVTVAGFGALLALVLAAGRA